MAHADYDCCACCDSKMEYRGSAAATKERLCEECKTRTGCADPEEMLARLVLLNNAAALALLHLWGFVPCYYPNPVDDALIARGLVLTRAKEGGKWGKKLAPVGSPPMAIAPDSDEEWALEQRAFAAANSPDVPAWARQIVQELWREVVAREPRKE